MQNATNSVLKYRRQNELKFLIREIGDAIFIHEKLAGSENIAATGAGDETGEAEGDAGRHKS